MAGLAWNKEEDEFLKTLRPYLSTEEIFQVFQDLEIGRTKEAISRRARRLDVTFIDLEEPPLENLAPNARVAVENVLRRRSETLSTIRPPYLLTPSDKSRVSTALKNAANTINEQLEERRLEVPRKGSMLTTRAVGSGESLCLLLSDLHIGRRIVDQSTRERIYDIQIGLERVRAIPDKILSNLPKEPGKYDELVLLILGDIVDGEDIFPGHAQQIQQSAEGQTSETVRALWHTVLSLSKIFPIVRIATAPGNHGRFGASNWDNVVYRQLEILIDSSDRENISIKNRYEKFNIVNVKGHKGLLRHSAPAQADTAAARARLGGWNDIHNFDFLSFGHFHHWGIFTWNGKPIFRNGSLMGADDYAEELAVSDVPCQLIFGVTEETLPTMIIPIGF